MDCEPSHQHCWLAVVANLTSSSSASLFAKANNSRGGVRFAGSLISPTSVARYGEPGFEPWEGKGGMEATLPSVRSSGSISKKRVLRKESKLCSHILRCAAFSTLDDAIREHLRNRSSCMPCASKPRYCHNLALVFGQRERSSISQHFLLPWIVCTCQRTFQPAPWHSPKPVSQRSNHANRRPGAGFPFDVEERDYVWKTET